MKAWGVALVAVVAVAGAVTASLIVARDEPRSGRTSVPSSGAIDLGPPDAKASPKPPPSPSASPSNSRALVPVGESGDGAKAIAGGSRTNVTAGEFAESSEDQKQEEEELEAEREADEEEAEREAEEDEAREKAREDRRDDRE